MPNQFILKENRRRIIESDLQNHGPSSIATIMGFKKTYVAAIIIIKYKKGESIERVLKGSPRHMKLNNGYKEFIREQIDLDCEITLNKLKILLYEQKEVQVGLSTIDRCINSFQYTIKRVHNLPERRNILDVFETRAQYANALRTIIASIDESKNFFLDKIGFNVSMRSRRGISLIGSRAVYTVPNIRSRNISVCSLISKNGIFLYKAQTCAYNTDFFSAFIDDILTKPESDNISNAVIIMDSVSFHRSQIISKKFQVRTIELCFYSPHTRHF
jgi:hypothetical protein